MVDLSFRWLCGFSICRCELHRTSIHTHLYIDSVTNFYTVCNTDANADPDLNLHAYSDIYTNIHTNKYSDADTNTNLHANLHIDADLYTYIYSDKHTLSDSNAVTASDYWTCGLRSLGGCRLVSRE